MEISEEYSFENTCRTCLAYHDNLIPINDLKKTNPEFFSAILVSLNLKVITYFFYFHREQ